jgi:hypothetical protein
MQLYGIPSCVGPGAAGHTPGQVYCPVEAFHLHGLLTGVGAAEGVAIGVGIGEAVGVGAPGTPTQTKTSAWRNAQSEKQ